MELAVMLTLKDIIRDRIIRKLGELPSDISNIIKNNFALSGGAIPSLYHREPVSDYDLYFLDHAKDSMEVILDMIKMTKFKNYTTDSLLEKDYSGLWVSNTDNGTYVTVRAVTLPNKLQIITGGTLSEMRKNFDFVHCMPYYNLRDDKFVISEKQFECIKQKKLIKNSDFRDASREEKYYKKGYHYGNPTFNESATV